MDWLTGIQRVINYIEDHLTEEIDYEKIAKEALCSSFYLQRIFSILCGITLGDYIRNRRLTLAGNELSSSDKKVIDVALKYGYESPESFTRAFSKFHGITPSEAKKDGKNLKFFSRLSIKISLTGGNLLDYKIVDKDAFYIIEKKEAQVADDIESEKTITEYWERTKTEGIEEMLFNTAGERNRILGICYSALANTDGTFDYAVAAECKKEDEVPQGFTRTLIPERTWAIFECEGPIPEAMRNKWKTILSEFFTTSGYQPTYEMDIEIYKKGDRRSANYQSEIWVPVKKI